MSTGQRFLKRVFDLVGALTGLILVSWLILICWIIAALDTRASGFFRQARVGKGGKPFHIVKIRTMRVTPGLQTTVTTSKDARITRLGQLMRRTKLDELPQLWNVLIGQMSFVGPRPDVPGYADCLQGADRQILELRPGITGPASIALRDEQELLAKSDDPVRYNDEVLWPAKVRLNLRYLEEYRFSFDLLLILATLFPALAPRVQASFGLDLDR